MSIRAYGCNPCVYDTWAASTLYELLDIVVPTICGGYYYACSSSGTSGDTEPEWIAIPDSETVDGEVVWTCRAVPSSLSVELDTEGYGGYSLKDIWVRCAETAEFIVYGSQDGVNWRQIDEVSVPHG